MVKYVTIHNKGQIIQIEEGLNCKTQGGIPYLLWSKKAPVMQYLGSSEQEPVRLLGGHKGIFIGSMVFTLVPWYLQLH